MVRTLNGMQGELVRKGASAKDATSKQFEDIEQAIIAADASSWKESRNARAAATFLLCGGSHRAIRKIADANLFSERDLPLVSGSLAYAEGRKQDAAKLLLSIDPRAQPVTLGGHLALIQGGLLIGVDNARAQELFDLARLLMPSSLVEEAALRREISIVDALHAPDKFLLLGRRYVTQYGKSPFARNFWNEAGAVTLRVALNIEEQRLTEFQELFKDGAPATKFEVYMSVARVAILNARVALAAAQTRRAEPFADTETAKKRLKFYSAAIEALSGDFEDATAIIQQIDTRAFSRGDLEMREIVTAAVKRLQSLAESDTPAASVVASMQEPLNRSQSDTSVEASARQALADSEALLQRASRQ